MNKKNKLLSGLFVSNGMDIPFFIIMLGLMAFGLVMLLSSSYAYSYYETDGESSLHFFFREIIFMGLGLTVMYVFSRLDYKKLKYFANIALVGSWGLVLLTIVIGKIEGEGEINRWLDLGPFDIQPSEIAKFAVVLFCATGLDKNHKKMVSTRPSKVSWAVKLSDITNGKVVVTEGTVTLFFYVFFIALTAGFVLLGRGYEMYIRS